MTTKLHLLLFSGVDLARQVGIGTLLVSGRKLLRQIGWAFARLNEPIHIDERTLKDLGISRAQLEFELSRPTYHYLPCKLMKSCVDLATCVVTRCARFSEASHQRRVLHEIQALGHPGVLADVNAACTSHEPRNSRLGPFRQE
jgi:hypothetical protein